MLDFFKLFFGLLVVVAVIIFAALLFEKFISEEIVNIDVIKTEKVTTDSGEEYYLIYTKDETFENRDNYFHDKGGSRELASKLKEGRRYRVKVVGYDFGIYIPMFLEHRNIIEIVDTKIIIVK